MSEKASSVRNSDEAGPLNHFSTAVPTICVGGGKNALCATRVSSSHTTIAMMKTAQRCRNPRILIMPPPDRPRSTGSRACAPVPVPR